MTRKSPLTVSPLEEEIQDLGRLLAGIPAQMRQGGAFSTYELRLEVLRQKATTEAYLQQTARLTRTTRAARFLALVLALSAVLQLGASAFRALPVENASWVPEVAWRALDLVAWTILLIFSSRVSANLSQLSGPRSGDSGTTSRSPDTSHLNRQEL